MFSALASTITELFDSKKAGLAFLTVLTASVLHLGFGVAVEQAMFLASPFSLALVGQAHVDASAAKAKGGPSIGNIAIGTEVSNPPADATRAEAGYARVSVMLAIATLGFSAIVGGSGCGPSARQTALRASYDAGAALGAGVRSWNQEAMAQIVASATSEADGVTKLDALAKQVEPALTADKAFWNALIAAAAIADAKSLDDVLAALKELRRAAAAATGGKIK